VSWTFASLLILGIALAIGFAWYERAHPPAKVVALVATLAGLAAVGRIAFAPVPNVKPTTDIVLIAGFALGGGPGFVVGAVAALTSNLFFGQGPWTPWQMVAWGLVGVLGAVLARASGRQMGRVPLALWCGAAGFAFGAIMDLSTWVTFSGDQTLDRFLAIAGTSLPWNLAHAAGNVAFFLAFGPVLVRSLERFRARFQVTWQPAVATAVLALVAVGAAAAPERAAAAADPATERAAAYLERAQNADGGWGPEPGAGSTSLHSAWVVMGLAATGRSPGAAAAGYVSGRGRATGTAADLERTILAVAATGGDTSGLARKLRAKRRADGSFAGLVNVTAFGVLALRAAAAGADDDPVVRDAARWVARQQNADGGFSYSRRGAPSGTDDTGAAVMALVAAGRRTTPTVLRAARYLTRQRGRDGGWPLTAGAPSNSQSTAWAVQALLAARRGDVAPGLAYLRRMQRPDGGVRYSRTSAQTPVWVTAQAVAALAGQPLPVPAPAAVPPPREAPREAPRENPAKSRTERAPRRKRAPEPKPRRPRPAKPADPAEVDAALARALAPQARAAGALTALFLGSLQVK
jgi:energy-coupling factor transport system substrate-specific component